MTQATCSVQECTRPAKSRGWCNTHYERWRIHGDHTFVTTYDLPSRFWAKVDRTDPDGCWRWTAALNQFGYGVIGITRRQNKLAHRLAYEMLVGPIPEGLDLDHLCRVRKCVNPQHLEPVTRQTNLLRGQTTTARNAAKTHCPAGHPYSGWNLMVRPNGSRHCRACHYARKAVARAAARI